MERALQVLLSIQCLEDFDMHLDFSNPTDVLSPEADLILKWVRKRRQHSWSKSYKAVSSAAGKKKIPPCASSRSCTWAGEPCPLRFNIVLDWSLTGARPTTCCSITRTKSHTEDPPLDLCSKSQTRLCEKQCNWHFEPIPIRRWTLRPTIWHFETLCSLL